MVNCHKPPNLETHSVNQKSADLGLGPCQAVPAVPARGIRGMSGPPIGAVSFNGHNGTMVISPGYDPSIAMPLKTHLKVVNLLPD